MFLFHFEDFDNEEWEVVDYEDIVAELPGDHPLVWNWFLENLDWLKKQLEQKEGRDGEENNRC